jgi:hypothetical protein
VKSLSKTILPLIGETFAWGFAVFLVFGLKNDAASYSSLSYNYSEASYTGGGKRLEIPIEVPKRLRKPVRAAVGF